jgi:PEP-CTERM motif
VTFAIFRILTVFILVLFALPLISQAQTEYTIGAADSANFAVLYEGNGGQQMQFNNSSMTGNIGIGNNGTFDSSGGCAVSCLITGTVEFAAAGPVAGQFTTSGTTYVPALGPNNPLYSQTAVQTALNNLNSLSQSLGVESGTSTTITSGGSINASSGVLDGSGNRVFSGTVDSSFTAGTTFTINGTNSQYVVINIPSTGGHGFNGSIVLTGGITADHVLFNLDGGNYSTLTGGDTLTISTNGNTTMGLFLDPNGDIQINHSVLDGRIIGGDTHNLSVVSGASIINTPTVTPEPGAMLLFGTGLLAMGGVLRRRFVLESRSISNSVL